MKDLQEDSAFSAMRERLGRYEEKPSEELWGKIAASQNKSRAGFAWITDASVVIGVALLLFFLNGSEIKKETQHLKTLTTKTIATQTATTKTATPVQQHQSLLQTTKPISILARQDIQPETSNSKPETISDSTISLTTTIPQPKKDSSSVTTVIPPYKKPHSKFQVYLSVTPSLSFQKIIPGGNDDVIIQGLANRSPMSMKRFGFGIDAGFQREVNEVFGFYGGLSFYRQQQEITYNYYSKEADVTRVGDSWTFEINRPQQSQTFNYTMTNVGLRSGILVTLKGEKLKHKFGAGLAYMHGIAKADGAYNNAQSSYLSYQVFYRNEIRINDRFSWYIEPMFNYSFISKEKLAEPFRLKPYRAGISGGVLYRF